MQIAWPMTCTLVMLVCRLSMRKLRRRRPIPIPERLRLVIRPIPKG